MVRHRRAICAVLLIGAFSAASACRNPTQVTVVISAGLPCRDLSSGVSIAVAASPEACERNVATHFASATTKACEADGTIGTLVVTPSGGTGAVVVVAGYGGQDPQKCTADNGYKSCIIARRAFAFIDHTSLTLPIRLSPDCVGVPCDVLTTCARGACVPSKVDCSGGECPHLEGDAKEDGGATRDSGDEAADASKTDASKTDASKPDGGGLSSDPECAVAAGEPMAFQDFPTLSLKYCIDRTEVTQREYDLFLEQTPTKIPTCNFGSKKVLMPAISGMGMCSSATFSPTMTPSLPVVCVDRCDAHTYCMAVGKRVCTDDEYSVACQSGNLANTWTFGAPFDGKACNGSDSGLGRPAPVGTIPSCVNQGAPGAATPVFDMSGNVWEWTGGANARGGGFRAGPPELTCRTTGAVPAEEYTYEIGFRCCKTVP